MADKPKITITETTTADIVHVVENCREADKVEFGFACEDGETMLDVMFRMKRMAHRCYTGKVDGEIVIIYGIIPQSILSSKHAFPWAMTSEAVETRKNRKAFLNMGRIEMARLCRGYETFSGIVHTENRKAIRWLRWMGFNVGNEIHDVNGGSFLVFDRSKAKDEVTACVR